MHKFFGSLELIRLRNKQPLEHVAEMSDVELVVEVRRSLPEIGSHLNQTEIIRRRVFNRQPPTANA